MCSGVYNRSTGTPETVVKDSLRSTAFFVGSLTSFAISLRLRAVALALRASRSKNHYTHSAMMADHGRIQDHQAQRGLLQVVYRCDCRCRTGRLRSGKRLHDHPAQWLRDLGKDAAGAGRYVQGNGASERLFSAFHTGKFPSEGSRTRGRICSRSGCRDSRRGFETRRTAGDPADVGDDHLEYVPELDPVLSGSAVTPQSMVQCRSVGNADTPVPENHGILVAGRPYRSRDL